MEFGLFHMNKLESSLVLVTYKVKQRNFKLMQYTDHNITNHYGKSDITQGLGHSDTYHQNGLTKVMKHNYFMYVAIKQI